MQGAEAAQGAVAAATVAAAASAVYDGMVSTERCNLTSTYKHSQWEGRASRNALEKRYYCNAYTDLSGAGLRIPACAYARTELSLQVGPTSKNDCK